MKNILVSIFAVLSFTNVLSADQNYPLSEKDVELCTTVATMFDDVDPEFREICIHEAQMIRNTHQCPDTVDAVSCIQTSCKIKAPVEVFTEEMLECLTKHVSAKDKEPVQATAVFFGTLMQSFGDKSDPIERDPSSLYDFTGQIENKINSVLDDAIHDID